MSGGSYNYLCYKDAEDILSGQCTAELLQMAGRLITVCPEAAEKTTAMVIAIQKAKEEIQESIDSLQPLWKAVEWKDSGDIGDEGLQEAIEKWLKQKTK